MATDRYEDCGLYVDATDEDELMAILPQHFRVEAKFSTLMLPGFEVDVERNDLLPKGASTEDFVNWRAIVEVYAGEETSDEQMVRFVIELMSYLRSAGYRVVAACDFEDELPQTDFR